QGFRRLQVAAEGPGPRQSPQGPRFQEDLGQAGDGEDQGGLRGAGGGKCPSPNAEIRRKSEIRNSKLRRWERGLRSFLLPFASGRKWPAAPGQRFGLRISDLAPVLQAPNLSNIRALACMRRIKYFASNTPSEPMFAPVSVKRSSLSDPLNAECSSTGCGCHEWPRTAHGVE